MKRYKVIALARQNFVSMYIDIPKEIKQYWTIKEQENAIMHTKKEIEKIDRTIGALKMFFDNKYPIIFTPNEDMIRDIYIDRPKSCDPCVIKMSSRIISMVDNLRAFPGMETSCLTKDAPEDAIYYLVGILDILKLKSLSEIKHLVYLNAEV